MALGVAIDRGYHRFDSEIFPVVALTDTDPVSRLKIKDWYYFQPFTDSFTVRFPNRSIESCPVVIRNMIEPTFVLDTGINSVVGGVLSRSSGEGYNGAYYDTALSAAKCSVEALIMSTTLSTGISLQNGDTAIVDNYNDPAATHSMTFGQAGYGSIRELGVLVPANPNFKYAVGDRAMIELENGIVRYYLIKPDRSMILLRTTRSKLTAAPKAEWLLYFTGAQLQECFVHSNDEASTSLQIAGVLEDFQDWKNPFFHASTAQGIELANGEMQFTFANSKTRIKTLNAQLAMRQKLPRLDFVDFFYHHGIEKDFIFVDLAHKDRDDNATEFWAKFASPFGDAARYCLFSHDAQIVESYRQDVLIKEIEIGSLTVELEPVELPGEYPGDFTFLGTYSHTGNGRVETIDIYVDDVLYEAGVPVTSHLDQTFTGVVRHADFALGSHDVKVVGHSYGSLSDESNEVTMEFI